jgi:hypothetical protein
VCPPYAATLAGLPEDPLECDTLAETSMEQAQRMTIGDSGVKAHYQRLCEEVTRMQAVAEKHAADVIALQACAALGPCVLLLLHD